jgi:predicted MPP superfamily phosphohydrolase
MKVTLGLLSISFVLASLRGWYSHSFLVRWFYRLAALWLGIASYFLWASLLCWMVYGSARLAGLGWPRAYIADALFGAAILTSAFAVVNASWLRVTRIKVELPNLPPQWRGRTAGMVSDLHLGHVRNGRFVRRVVRKLAELQPDIVLIAGDLYDGMSADFEKLAQPWAEFIAAQTKTPALGKSFLGVFAIPGNHEEFYRYTEYLAPLVRAGVHFLHNEKVEVDGLQLAGVNYSDAVHPENYRAVLRQAQLEKGRPSILLLHAPVQLPISLDEGISLQLSGHTHGGQFFPYTWIAGRVWGRFIYGLQRLGSLQIYTSYGAGTWGPPMRLGTRPEIVLIELQPLALGS